MLASNLSINKKRNGFVTLKRQEAITGYAFILPNLIGVFFFVALPVILSLFLSFTEYNGAQGIGNIKFAGMENYIKMWTDDRFKSSIMNNFYYTFGSVPVTIILAIVLAAILNKFVYGRLFLRMMYFIPSISSIVSVAVVWLVLFYPDGGPVNQILQKVFGIANPPDWFVSTKWALPGMILMSIWHGLGYYMIILLSGLQNIPAEIYEASEIDGANFWQRFTRITVPMLAPSIFFVSIIATITSFKVFDQISIMTSGGPGYSTSVLVYCIYYYAFELFNMGYASAIAWVLFIIIFIFTLIQWKWQKKTLNY